MAENLDPINIDINLNQNVSEESESASQGLDNLALHSNAALSAMEKDTNRQIKVIKQMTYVIDELQKQMSVHPELFDANQVARLDTIRQTLTDTQSQLESYIQSYASMSDAIVQGADITDLISDSMQELADTEGVLRDSMNEIMDAQSQMNDVLGNGTDTINDNIAATSLLSTVIQQVCASLGIENTALVRSISGTRTLTGVKTLYTNATQLLNTQLGISIALSKALVATGIGLIIAAIAAVVYAYSQWKEKQDEVNRGLEDNRRLMEKASATVAQQTTLFNKMQKEYTELGDSLEEKKKYIDQNQKAFTELGISVQSVNDADNLFIKNADAFRESIMLRAKAAASMELATEKYKESLMKMNEAEQRRKNPTYGDKVFANLKNPLSYLPGGAFFVDRDKKYSIEANKAADEIETAGENLATASEEFFKNSFRLKEDWEKFYKNNGFKDEAEIIPGTKAFYEQQKKRAAERMAALKDTQKDTEEFKKAFSEYNQAVEKLKIWDMSGKGAADNTLQKAQKMIDDQLKIDNARKKSALNSRNAEIELQQDRINLMDDGFSKEQKQAELNHQKELLSIDKRTQELMEREQNSRRKEFEAKGGKGTYKSDVTSVSDLSFTDQTEIENARQVADDKYKKATEDLLNNLLDKYQDYNARRLEIDRQYEADLTALESQSPTEKTDAAIAQLKKQWQEALSSVDMDELKDTLDWESVFGNLDKVSSKTIDNLRKKLKDYLSEFGKNLAPEDLKTLVDALGNLDRKFAELNPQDAFSDSWAEVKKAFKEYRQISKDNAKSDIEKAKALDKLKGSLTGMNDSFQGYVSQANDILDAGNELMGLVNELGIELPQEINAYMEGMSKVLSSAEKIDLTKPATIISGTIGMLTGVLHTITGVFGGKSNVISEEEFKRYDNLINVLQEVAAAQTELIDSLSGSAAIKATDEAIDSMKKIEEAARNMGRDWLNSGASKGFLGIKSSASEGKKLYDNIKKFASEFNQLDLGVTFEDLGGRVDGLFNLSYEQLTRLKKELPQLWATLDDKTKEYLETIINTSKQADETREKLNESLTGVSFDSLKNSLDDLVTQADMTFENISGSFSNHMSDAILKMVKSKYLTTALSDWYDQFATAMNDDNLTESEADLLRIYYEQIATTANSMYKQAMDLAGIDTGSDSARTGTSKGLATASQDSINELNGNFYAIRQQVGDIRNLSKEANVMSKAMQSYLFRITENTEYCRYLLDVKNSLEDMQARGLKIKS